MGQVEKIASDSIVCNLIIEIIPVRNDSGGIYVARELALTELKWWMGKRGLIVPTLCVGMHPVTLCVTLQKRNAERPWRRSHAGA
ncbi:hypothetical protein J2W43_000380 [Pseudomonas brassicacearum]|uniref:Uncharacterized protein n=1 Tax=Pseudomonas brassicacearum TaxID=930166 RepID=A0AAW8M528_9PSED|nr:hypothetical protein [Pseudomonas brassicacearum]